MSADYTTVGLIANCRRRAFLTAGSGLPNSDVLQVLTEQLRTYVPAFLKGLREEYIIASLSIAVTSATVSIPARAVGAALRTIGWLEADGRVKPLTRIEPERRNNFAQTDNTPCGYVLRGNTAILVPAVTSGTLVVTYQQRPGQLVLPSACAKVTSIVAANILGFAADTIPSGWTTASVLDLVSATPNFDLLGMDLALTSVSSTQLRFTADVSSSVAVGDYVSLATETCIPQLILEAHDLIAQSAASQIANSTGSARKDAIAEKLKELRDELSVLLSPRSDGSSRPIVSKSAIGRGWF